MTPSSKETWRLAVSSAPALPSMINKIFYLSLITTVFVFVSMLLLTGFHL